MILSEDPQPTPLAWQRMRVNQAHNTLYNSLNQAMQEPAFNSHYLADMKLWVTHSQFIVEHINAMTTLAREHRALPPELAQEYLQSWDIVLPKYKTIIFVHGCFWHQHEGCKKALPPKSNVSFWLEKFRKNKERDRKVIRTLQESGWKVIVVWQCEIPKIKNNPEIIKKLISEGVDENFIL